MDGDQNFQKQCDVIYGRRLIKAFKCTMEMKAIVQLNNEAEERKKKEIAKNKKTSAKFSSNDSLTYLPTYRSQYLRTISSKLGRVGICVRT